MKTFTLTLDYIPIWTRPRRNGNHYYRPQSIEDQRDAMRLAAQEVIHGDWDITSTYSVEILVTKKRPKASKTNYPRFDIDNILKEFLDTMQTSGFIDPTLWVNDAQVLKATVEKQYGEKDSITYWVREYKRGE